jgi:hypothetical protein
MGLPPKVLSLCVLSTILLGYGVSEREVHHRAHYGGLPLAKPGG